MSSLGWILRRIGQLAYSQSHSKYVDLRKNMRKHLTPRIVRKLDERPIPDAPHELRMFLKVRNEELRLPYVLQYYLEKGIDRIFVVDNDSTDKTREIASECERVHLFRASDNFRYHWNWLEYLMDRYGKNQWCLNIDADEILAYPHWEHRSIRDVCTAMEHEGSTIMRCLMLDMYSDKPIREAVYLPGQNPLEVAPFFDGDRSDYSQHLPELLQQMDIRGGMRKRVMASSCRLTKHPLFRNQSQLRLSANTHLQQGGVLSSQEGVLFHYKYFSDFAAKTQEATTRKVYWFNAKHYQEFSAALQKDPDLCPMYEKSVRFESSEQLVKLGFLKGSLTS